MKFAHWIAISLIANVGLLGAIGLSRAKRGAKEAVQTAGNATISLHPALRNGKAGSSASLIQQLQTEPEPFTWRLVESKNYKAYIANLRAIGCPEETIKDIIFADVNRLHAARMKKLWGELIPNSEYWQGQDTYDNANQEFLRQQRQAEREKHALLVELLGVDPQKEQAEFDGDHDHNEKLYAFLTEEKRKLTQEIAEKYAETHSDLSRKYKGYWGEEYQEEWRQIEKQQRSELVAVLTLQELEEFELRASRLASQLHHELKEFEPSEKEFREIFKLKQAFDDVFGGYMRDPDDKEGQKRYQEARQAMESEIKAKVGEVRFTDYARGLDHDYQQLSRLTKRQGLPKEAAKMVYDIKDAALQQAHNVRSDGTLSREQRAEALKAIQAETEKAVNQTLSDKAYKSYRSDYGWWMRNLGN